MALSFHPQTLKGPLLHKHHFLGTTNLSRKSNFTFPKIPQFKNVFTAKFNLYEMMGGRGLCYGEEGLQQELKKPVSNTVEEEAAPTISSASEENSDDLNILKKDAFEKELLGLTGGFPGGEMGLQKFIQQNPPPKI
ncbi:hypothetical protein CASFOL_010919 [Castilleja foliolosa]|uniref:Uncharacterized protein n=1 Tax=Castilleja foliolosa TaxID=1961234 RepID=A0ABD3DXS3_9LAMI